MAKPSCKPWLETAAREMRAADHRRRRKESLREMARRHGVELPVMPSEDVTAILEAAEALVAAGIDPGDWDPDGTPT